MTTEPSYCSVKPGLMAHFSAAIPIPAESLVITAAPPDAITARNAEIVLGLSRREFLRLLRIYPHHVAAHGRLRIVRRTEFIEWLFACRPSAGMTAADEGDASEHAVARAAQAVGMVVQTSSTRPQGRR